MPDTNTTNHSNPLFDDFTLEDAAPGRRSLPPIVPPVPAEEALAHYALDAALDRRARRRIATATPLAVVIAVPSAAWVEPVERAAESLGSWDRIIVRSGTDRASHRPDRGNEGVVEVLGRGGRILGVAPDPQRHLPSTLTGGADLRITIPHPSSAILRRVIRAATGRTARRLPEPLGLGLDYQEICSAVRLRTSPGSCVRRIQALVSARALTDPGVAAAPLLSELCGYGEAMAWARRLVVDIEAWRRGELAFDAIDRRAVLASPPGLGKSLLARSLARTAGLPLVTTSVSAWFAAGSYLDSVLRSFDQAVAAANAHAPAVLFIDELDALPNRASLIQRDTPWWGTLVSHVLLALDSSLSTATAKLVVLGATNFPQRLDEALVRPGRLSRIIRIQPPDATALAGILRLHLGGDLPGTDLAAVARLGEGASGAQAAAWVEGARRRARAAGRPLAFADLLAEVAPPEIRSPATLRRCALHESGHACVAHLTGAAEVTAISLVDRHGGGYVLTRSAYDPALRRADLEMMVIVGLAGRAAEEMICGGASSGAGGSASSDLAIATGLLASLHGALGLGETLAYRASPEAALGLVALDPELRRTVEADLRRLYACALALVREHRVLVEAVAELLVARRHLDGGDFLRIFRNYARTTRRRRNAGGRHG
ncbi:AAA family ATPase [Microvirga zambiensis]|uniref:AAA family ATPase n=1 Tax=Microvirga zambiensis TaxID=1402137 RepID=UPI00191DB28A|nr:AAA family ATPase [Microvirga zambiensis]